MLDNENLQLDQWYPLPAGSRKGSSVAGPKLTKKLLFIGEKTDDRMCFLNNAMNLLHVSGDEPLLQELSVYTDFESWSKVCGKNHTLILLLKCSAIRVID